MRVVGRALVIPIADDTCGEDQQRQQRQRNSDYTKGLLHSVFGRSEPAQEPVEY